MSQEILEILETVNKKELRIQLALQCAPLLTGIKISNLLIVNRNYHHAVKKIFSKTVISYHIIYKSEDKVTFLLYQKEGLNNYLWQREVQVVMKSLGYDIFQEQDMHYILGPILREFSVRFMQYMNEKKPFPHEMGLLLGYPVDDVIGFIENEGKNFLYTGYWKVYNNLSERMILFQQYNQARERVLRMVSQGVSIHRIIECTN